MEDFTDAAIVLALCCVPLLWLPSEPFAVAGALGAVALTCLRPAGAPRWLRWGALAAFLAAAVAWPACTLFLPMGAYVGLRERSWMPRLAWAPALAAVLARGLLGPASAVALCVLCAVAAALAVRETRALAERAALRSMRDGLREAMMQQADDAMQQAATSSAIGAGSAGGSPSEHALSGSSTAAACAPHGGPAAFDGLTQRELAIVQLVARGLDNKEIAASLYLSEGTVRNHISAVLQKHELKNRTQLAVLYLGAPLG